MHPKYAESLKENGTLRELTHCGGWMLERQILGSLYRTGMECYSFDYKSYHLSVISVLGH